MKRLTQFVCVIAAIAVSSVFAAKAPAKPAPKQELTVWIMPNGASPQEKLEQRLNLFTKKTGIKTKIVVLDWGEAWNRISTTLASGNDAPDVLQLGTTWIPYFASRGEIKALNPWLSSIDSSRFVPVSWNTTRIDADTIIYSVPWFIDIRPILANKRILKKNNIKPEDVSTFDGFVNAVRKVRDSHETLEDGTKISAFAFPGKSDWNIPHNFAPWVWSNGGDFISKDKDGKWKAAILTPKTIYGIAKYLSFVLDSLVSTDALQLNTAQIVQHFNAGELAFIVNTSEVIMQTRIDGAKGGLFNTKIGLDSVIALPIPTGTKGSICFIGGSNLAIPAKNDRKEALDLLLYLTNDENLDAYTKQIGMLPASKKVLQSWSKDEDYKTIVTMLDAGRTYTAIPEWGDIEQILVSMFSAIWDHLEIPALYSEEKIYEILMQNSNDINKRLNHRTTDDLTFAEFREIWHKALNITETKKETRNTAEQPKQVKEEDSGSGHSSWLFALAVLAGFIFAVARKKKN
ncbi:MAG: sugar ABC transporter substrate-binding protein [Fibrobacter sp.]|nr:sugar ABC transporter substrate-binding protein [Fibrobacter sp.]